MQMGVYNPDGTIDGLKAILVARDYEQTYDIDYFETFSLCCQT